MLPDIAHAPRILPNYTQNIPANLKKVQMYQFTLWMDVYVCITLLVFGECSLLPRMCIHYIILTSYINTFTVMVTCTVEVLHTCMYVYMSSTL